MIRKILVILGNIGVVVIFVVLIGALGAMRPQPEKGTPQTFDPTVFVQTVAYAPTQLRVDAQGEVRPKNEINLASQVGGKIVSVAPEFADGGTIRDGQVLVQIEDADYRLAVTRARAQVATARQALEIERAESALAQQDFSELGGGNGAPPASELTLRRPQLARAEAEYNGALANLQDAELGLSRTRVKAPFNGRVRNIQANLGQFISPGQQLGRIFSTDVVEVRLPLTDEDLARLGLPLAFNDPKTGPQVKLQAEAAGEMRTWTGRVVRIDAAIDSSTRQISAIVEIADPYGMGADKGFPLAVGLFVDAEIEGPRLDRATIVPRSALLVDESVFVVDAEDRLHRQPVTVAATTNEGVVITGGLEEGQKVVISRVTSAAGSKVRPLDPKDPAASAPVVTPAPEKAAAKKADAKDKSKEKKKQDDDRNGGQSTSGGGVQ